MRLENQKVKGASHQKTVIMLTGIYSNSEKELRSKGENDVKDSEDNIRDENG